MRRKLLIAKIMVFIVLLLSATFHSAMAIEATEWYKEPLYIDRAFGKGVHGVWNLMFGWLELGNEPYETVAIGDNVFVGIGRGIYYAVADTAGGALNIITFPITALKIPLPNGGIESHKF